MPREIKFRVWDEINKKFYQNFDIGRWIGYDANLNEIFKNGPFVFQQFTGLKDSDGKEIVEGDLVSLRLKNGFEQILEARFGYGAPMGRRYFGVYFASKDEKFNFNPYDEIQNLEKLEIVGNIFENPELLQE